MIRFVIRRLLMAVVVVWLISVAVFALFYLAPADPARAIAGRLATPETVAAVRHRLGLDLPVPEQYLHFINGLAHGDLGYSFYNSEPVATLVAARIPVTMSLTLGAAVIWLLLGIGLGVLSARRPRTRIDRTATIFVLTGLSAPTFLVGLLLLYFFFFRLHLVGVDAFPGGGYVPFSQNPAEWAQHLILPWTTLAFVSAAAYTRLTRTALLEVLGEDYVRTARAKGITERRVVYRHALRSALPPSSPSSASMSAACWAERSSPKPCSVCPGSASSPFSRSPTRTCRSSWASCSLPPFSSSRRTSSSTSSTPHSIHGSESHELTEA